MDGNYEISADVARSLLRITVRGFFDRDRVLMLARERNAACARFRCGPNRHVTICDVSESRLSTQEIVGEFRQVIGDPRYASRRLAFVTGLSLGRMQLRRMVERDHVRCFETADEAETWLFAADADAIPTPSHMNLSRPALPSGIPSERKRAG